MQRPRLESGAHRVEAQPRVVKRVLPRADEALHLGEAERLDEGEHQGRERSLQSETPTYWRLEGSGAWLAANGYEDYDEWQRERSYEAESAYRRPAP